jgi:hypothetical protein
MSLIKKFSRPPKENVFASPEMSEYGMQLSLATGRDIRQTAAIVNFINSIHDRLAFIMPKLALELPHVDTTQHPIIRESAKNPTQETWVIECLKDGLPTVCGMASLEIRNEPSCRGLVRSLDGAREVYLDPLLKGPKISYFTHGDLAPEAEAVLAATLLARARIFGGNTIPHAGLYVDGSGVPMSREPSPALAHVMTPTVILAGKYADTPAETSTAPKRIYIDPAAFGKPRTIQN